VVGRFQPYRVIVVASALAVSVAGCSLIVDVGDLTRGDADATDVDGDVPPPDAADADIEADGEADADLDADSDMPVEADTDDDGDADAEASTDADADGDADAEVADGDDAEVPDECAGQPNFTPCTLVTVPDRSYDICLDGTCVSPGCGDASCNAPGPNWTVPDTNQRLCYDASTSIVCPDNGGTVTCTTTAFCGQDWQYGWDMSHMASERFTRTATTEPLVTDNVTGLVWQGCAAGRTGTDCGGAIFEPDWSGAVEYCETLTWGGLTDWRLPSRYELQSLVDYGTSSHPAIDRTAFPATPSAPFWSSSSSPWVSWTTKTNRAGERFDVFVSGRPRRSKCASREACPFPASPSWPTR
jgi:hypothetical protein